MNDYQMFLSNETQQLRR